MPGQFGNLCFQESPGVGLQFSGHRLCLVIEVHEVADCGARDLLDDEQRLTSLGTFRAADRFDLLHDPLLSESMLLLVNSQHVLVAHPSTPVRSFVQVVSNVLM